MNKRVGCLSVSLKPIGKKLAQAKKRLFILLRSLPFAANNEQEVQRAERARISELANHMSCADERRSKDRKLTRLNDSLALQTMTYEQAETRSADRMDEAHTRTAEVYNDLLESREALQVRYRDHQDKLVSYSSLLEQREGDEIGFRGQIEELALWIRLVQRWQRLLPGLRWSTCSISLPRN